MFTRRIRDWGGKPIIEAGLYRGVPMAVYHGAHLCSEPSVSSSGLRQIIWESPAHYWCGSPYNKKRIENGAESPAFIFGRAVHHLLFGEADFRKLFVVRPEKLNGHPWNGNRLECRGWLERAEAQGLTVLTPAHLETIQAMAEVLGNDSMVQAGVLNGLIEQTFAWRDVDTGVWLKARPDAIPGDSLDFVDLKTTASVSLIDMRRSIENYAYYQQAALIGSACRAIFGEPMNSFTFFFVEKSPPYCTDYVTLTDAELKRGEELNEIAIRKFAHGMQTGEWLQPRGTRDEARYIELPEQARARIDAVIETERRELKLSRP